MLIACVQDESNPEGGTSPLAIQEQFTQESLERSAERVLLRDEGSPAVASDCTPAGPLNNKVLKRVFDAVGSVKTASDEQRKRSRLPVINLEKGVAYLLAGFGFTESLATPLDASKLGKRLREHLNQVEASREQVLKLSRAKAKADQAAPEPVAGAAAELMRKLETELAALDEGSPPGFAHLPSVSEPQVCALVPVPVTPATDTPTADTPTADTPTVIDIMTRPAGTRASAMIGRHTNWAKLAIPEPPPTNLLASPQWSGPQPGSDEWIDALLIAPPIVRQMIDDLEDSQMAANNKHSFEHLELYKRMMGHIEKQGRDFDTYSDRIATSYVELRDENKSLSEQVQQLKPQLESEVHARFQLQGQLRDSQTEIELLRVQVQNLQTQLLGRMMALRGP